MPQLGQGPGPDLPRGQRVRRSLINTLPSHTVGCSLENESDAKCCKIWGGA